MAMPKGTPRWIQWCDEHQFLVVGTVFGILILCGITWYVCDRRDNAWFARQHANFEQVSGMPYAEFTERSRRQREAADAQNAAIAEREARRKDKQAEEHRAFKLDCVVRAEREREKAKREKLLKECEEELKRLKREADGSSLEDDVHLEGPSNRFAPERERLVGAPIGGGSSDDGSPSESDQGSQEPLRTFETNGIRETEL